MNKQIGENTMSFGKKCKLAGKIGFFTALISFVFFLMFLIVALVSGSSAIIVFMLIAGIFMGISIALIPLYFVGYHFICTGKIEINTRALLGNVEIVNENEVNNYNKSE